MKSKLIGRRQQKRSTIVVSKQTVEESLRMAQGLGAEWMEVNPNDPRIDQLTEIEHHLSGLLQDEPQGMQSVEDYFDDAKQPQIAAQVQQEVNMIAKWRRETQPRSRRASWVSDRDEKGEPKAVEKAEVPRLAAKKKKVEATPSPAAPVVAPAKPAAAPANNLIDYIPTEALIKVIEGMPKEEDFARNKGKQDALIALTNVLKARPVMPPEQPKEAPAPAATSTAPALAAPVASMTEDPRKARVPLGGLTIAGVDGDEGENKQASNGSSWSAQDEDTGTIVEDGGRTPEIGEAHSKRDDNTGIKFPATTMPRKLAQGDMAVSRAVKESEKLGENLKRMYLDAKPLTQVNDSRPVREAVEAIFRAADMFNEATKTLNKQHLQEEAEEEATKIKEQNKKKSSFGGLSLAAEDDAAKKKLNGQQTLVTNA